MAVLKSLRVRVLLWVSLTLVLLFAVTIIGLDAIFQRSSEAVLREAMQVQLLGLIAAAEESEDEELSLPDDAMLDLSLTVPESGVYGVIWDADGVPIWRSASWAGREWFVNQWPVPGERIYLTIGKRGSVRSRPCSWAFAGTFTTARACRTPSASRSRRSRMPCARRRFGAT